MPFEPIKQYSLGEYPAVNIMFYEWAESAFGSNIIPLNSQKKYKKCPQIQPSRRNRRYIDIDVREKTPLEEFKETGKYATASDETLFWKSFWTGFNFFEDPEMDKFEQCMMSRQHFYEDYVKRKYTRFELEFEKADRLMYHQELNILLEKSRDFFIQYFKKLKKRKWSYDDLKRYKEAVMKKREDDKIKDEVIILYNKLVEDRKELEHQEYLKNKRQTEEYVRRAEEMARQKEIDKLNNRFTKEGEESESD
jgi:hypothetical protein